MRERYIWQSKTTSFNVFAHNSHIQPVNFPQDIFLLVYFKKFIAKKQTLTITLPRLAFYHAKNLDLLLQNWAVIPPNFRHSSIR